MTKPLFNFSYHWGSTHRNIDDLFICPPPPNIIFDLFRLLVIPYSWLKPLSLPVQMMQKEQLLK